MPAFLALLRPFLIAVGTWLAAFAMNNAVGWGVSIAVGAGFIVIWVDLLNHVYRFLLDELTSPIGVFAALPLGGVWILNQAFPLQYAFDCIVTVIGIRIFAAKLMIIAIWATRQLKGK